MQSIIKVDFKTYGETSAFRQGGHLAQVGTDVYFMFDCWN